MQQSDYSQLKAHSMFEPGLIWNCQGPKKDAELHDVTIMLVYGTRVVFSSLAVVQCAKGFALRCFIGTGSYFIDAVVIDVHEMYEMLVPITSSFKRQLQLLFANSIRNGLTEIFLNYLAHKIAKETTGIAKEIYFVFHE